MSRSYITEKNIKYKIITVLLQKIRFWGKVLYIALIFIDKGGVGYEKNEICLLNGCAPSKNKSP